MHLISLNIFGFRNFKQQQEFKFGQQFTIITGVNAVGKTNLLEAVYCLHTGSGFREKNAIELLFWDSLSSKLEGTYAYNDGASATHTVKFEKQPDEHLIRLFAINHLPKGTREYIKRSRPVVLFQPDDVRLLTTRPEKRRSFVDVILNKTDRAYYQAKQNYDRALYKRNKILETLYKEKETAHEVLGYWDTYLIKEAAVVQEKRAELVSFFNLFPQLEGDYFSLRYQQNVLNTEALNKTREKERLIRRTLCGPQLDEFVVFKNKENPKNLGMYGSRSEQRLAVLWMKLCEVRFYEQHYKQSPLLLMDDIFSELDELNSRRIFSIFQNYQTLSTTAQRSVIASVPYEFTEICLN